MPTRSAVGSYKVTSGRPARHVAEHHRNVGDVPV
jgi:hypothetical protein